MGCKEVAEKWGILHNAGLDLQVMFFTSYCQDDQVEVVTYGIVQQKEDEICVEF
jgi:hypothetical protein